LLCLGVYGCGPGFPIQTAEQEAFVTNVDTLDERVTRLEKGSMSDAAEVREELNAALATVAEATAGLEEVRQEFAFVRGSFEEADLESAQTKEDIRFTGEALQNVTERLDRIEADLLSTGEKIAALEASAAAGTGAVDASALTALEERVSALEKKDEAPPKKAARTAEPSPEDVYARGLKHTKDKEYPEATEAFSEFLAKFPKHKLADHAQYWLGEIYYAKGDWGKAIIEFDKVIKNYPDGDKVPAATLKEGFSFEKLGSAKEARVLLEQVIEKYPKSNEAEIAKKRIKGLKSE